MLIKIKFNDEFKWKLIIYKNEDIIAVQNLFDANFQLLGLCYLLYFLSVLFSRFFLNMAPPLGCPKKTKSPNFGMSLTPVVFIG